MSDNAVANKSRSFLGLLLAHIPLVLAIWISLDANRLAREQLRSSEQSMQRAYAPLLAAENPDFQEVLRGGSASHYEFFARVFNVSDNPAYNVSAKLYIGVTEIMDEALEVPVLFGNNVPEDKAGFLRSLAISANVPGNLAGAVLDGDPVVRLVIERDDSFGNRMRQTIFYRMAAQGKLRPVKYQNDPIATQS